MFVPANRHSGKKSSRLMEKAPKNIYLNPDYIKENDKIAFEERRRFTAPKNRCTLRDDEVWRDAIWELLLSVNKKKIQIFEFAIIIP